MTLVGVYIFQINQEFFIPLIAVIAIIVAVYYLIKSIGIYGKSKKEYIKNQNDINEIVKEELPETVETKRRRNVLENAMNTYEELNNQEDDDNNVIRSRKLKTSTRKVEDNENYDNEFDESIMIFKEKSIEEIEPKATTKKNTTRKTTKKADPESTKTAKTTATKKATTSKKTTATKEKIEPKEEKKEATTKKNTTKAKAPKKEETAEKKTTSKAKTAKKEETVEKKTTTKKDAEEEKTKATKKTTTAKKTTTKKKDETKK